MTYLIVDDEQIILEGMEWTLRDVVGQDAEIFTAGDPLEALEVAKKHTIDIAFCDVDMPGMNGLKLAEELRKISEDMEVIFATGYAHYSLDAWRTQATAFILKPVGPDEIRRVLDKVMRSREKKVVEVPASGKKHKGEHVVTAMCFGNFDLIYDEKPIHFARKKSKEMLAYLIDRRGAMISTDEIRTILWEEDVDTEEKKGYVRVLANDIRKCFEGLGIPSILLNDQNSYSVDVSRIECDYFDFMDGDEEAKKSFGDEYMAQYSWSEATLARLLNMKE